MNQHHREGDNDGDNGRFQARIDAAIATVRAWEDPGLLREIRSGIPLDVLRDDTGPYSEPRDVLLATGWGGSTNLKCLQRLARYFKSTMTWVDRPPCEHPSCANDTKSEMMEHVRTRGPESQQEREGRAMRVEEYRCQQCLNITTFPRYNSVSALLKSRRGRCGEYANLFGAHCRAMGLETRYILDFTDHVWTECLIDGSSSWVMVDSCEGVVNEPSMYEVGWGKELSYVLAVSNSEVVDVTPRYTRKFYLPNFQTRRRIVTSSEAAGQDRIWRFHQRLTRTLKPKREQEVSRRLAEEESYLGRCRSSTNWDGGTYDRGRISGSSTWKTFRNEDGARRFTNSTSESNTSRGQSTNAGVHQLEVESYCPSMLFGEELSIRVVPHPTASRHAAILLGQTACAVGHCDEGGNSRRLSVVVVDDGEAMLGCLLRSRSFGGISPLIAFLESVPTSRIVAAHGCLPAATAVAVREAAAGGDESSEDDADATSKGASRLRELLPGFITQYLCDGVQFVGQVRMKAEWSTCRSFSEAPFGIEVKLSVPVSTPLTDSQVQRLRLKTYRGIRPRVVTRRLEDRIMPLAAQLTATHGEKRAAFLSWIDARASCAGYVTRPGAPVYLLGQASYPLERVSDNSEEGEWSTFLWLPEPLVSGDDVGIAEVESISGNVKAATAYDVPLDTEFFTSRLGNEIMVKDGSLVDTAVALKNAKLIALYFSADWCRRKSALIQFFPMCYQHVMLTSAFFYSVLCLDSMPILHSHVGRTV
jgi:peptide-N4-(N-acetyl-beta-glucosaminyl)asparagine amidase